MTNDAQKTSRIHNLDEVEQYLRKKHKAAWKTLPGPEACRFVDVAQRHFPEDTYCQKAMYVGSIRVNNRFEQVYAYVKRTGAVVYCRGETGRQLARTLYAAIWFAPPFPKNENEKRPRLRGHSSLVVYSMLRGGYLDKFIEVDGTSLQRLGYACDSISRELPSMQVVENKYGEASLEKLAKQHDVRYGK